MPTTSNIAPIVERTPAATKKLASRARRKVQGTPVVPARGARAVAEGTVLLARRSQFAESALVNGTVGVVVAPRGHLLLALTFTIKDNKIAEYDVIADPARLQQLDLAVL